MILSRRVRRLLSEPVAAAAQVPDVDRYRKHFTADAHLWLLLGHSLSASPSLRQTHAMVAADPTFWMKLHLPPSGVSRSQLARSSTSRPVACFDHLFARLRDRLPSPAIHPVHIVDSSFLTLSEKLCPWSRHRGHAPGVRLHAGYDLHPAIPSYLRITGAETPDISVWRDRDWTELAGWTVLMDGGYYGHRDFAALRNAGVSWICPLNAQARVAVTADHQGPWSPTDAGDTVLADQTITLGSPNNRNGAVLEAMRLITSRNAAGVIHHTVTDRHDLSPTDILLLYRKRWQIELFFRFLKHQLGVLQTLGTSRQAVVLTLLLAAIVALLAMLLATARPDHITTIAWVRMLGQVLLLMILRRLEGVNAAPIPQEFQR